MTIKKKAGTTASACVWLCLLVALGVPASASSQPRCAKGWPWTDDLNVAGQVGDRDVRGYLGEARWPTDKQDALFGVFFDPATWTPAKRGETSMFAVEGTFAEDCSATLTEVNRLGEQQATWRLRFVTNTRLEGERDSAKGPRAAISLAVVSPVDCSGRGPWRMFRSLRWPITFSYPSAWRLAEERNSITLVCPDPARLALGGQGIWLELDPLDERIGIADGRSARTISSFMTVDSKRWRVGDCDDWQPSQQSVYCEPARKSFWRNMTVLQGHAGEDRLYRFGGGYAGQGGGILRYLFFVGKRRVSLSSRDASIDDKPASEGPVLFDGDDITARLVRSIRPK